jgi:hypothetical protein
MTHPENMRLFASEIWVYISLSYMMKLKRWPKRMRQLVRPIYMCMISDLKLKYRGQFDNSRPGNQQPPTGNDLASALEAIMAGEEPTKLQKPSIGCNIKWKNGGF